MIFKEPLNGGVVQTRDARLLRPGELQQADDTILRPADPAIHKAPGRDVFQQVRLVNKTASWADDSATITHATTFGSGAIACSGEEGEVRLSSSSAFPSNYNVGSTVIGTGIPSGTVVRQRISSSSIVISQPCTAAVSSIQLLDISVGMYVYSIGNFALGTKITAINSVTSITVSTNSLAAGTTTTISFAPSLDGIVSCQFDDNHPDLVAALGNGTIYTSTVGDLSPGSVFTAAYAGLSTEEDSYLNAIEFNNKYLLLTGNDRPRILEYLKPELEGGATTISIRLAGLLPTDEQSFDVTPINSGSWSNAEDLGNGYYWFLVTEVLRLSNGTTIESAYTGAPKGVGITTYTSQSIKVTLESVANDGANDRNTATHWRVYMSKVKSAGDVAPDLSEFYRQGQDIPIATTTITLSDNAPGAFSYPSSHVYDTYPPPGNNLMITLFGRADYPVANMLSAGAPANITASGNANQWAITATTDISGSHDSKWANAFNTNEVLAPFTKTGLVSGTTKLAIAASGPSSANSPIPADFTAELIQFHNASSNRRAYSIWPKNGSNGKRRGGLFGGFGFKNVEPMASATITGVKVELIGDVESDKDANPGFKVTLVKNGTAGNEEWGTWVFGGPDNLFGHTMTMADFTDVSNFQVRVRKEWGSGDEYLDHYIYDMRVTIYATGSSVNFDGEPYNTLYVSDAVGEAFGTSVDLPPPVASTGAVWEGCVILNDVSRPNTLVSSYPDSMEAYPDIYELPLQTNSNDKITCIRRLGQSLIIGCKQSVKRINYFPRETDSSFQQGRAYEDLANDHGIVGPRAACTVTIPGMGPVLAYVSQKGLMWTDGIRTGFLNEDLDYQNLFNFSKLADIDLVNYSRESMLVMYYAPAGETRSTKCMYFSYHPIHIKQGTSPLPANGPVGTGIGIKSACTVLCETDDAANSKYAGQEYLVSVSNGDGYAYVEDAVDGIDDSGVTNGNPAPTIRTRKIEIGEPGQMGRLDRVFLLVDATSATPTVNGFTGTVKYQNQGIEDTTSFTDSAQTTAISGVKEMWPDTQSECFDVTIAKSTTQTDTFRLHYIGFDVRGITMDANN